jgi:hypothetical protein
MKMKVLFIATAISLLVIGCSPKSTTESFCLLNTTESTLTINSVSKSRDVQSGEGYVITDITHYEGQDISGLSEIYEETWKPLFITMDGVTYQIDKTQEDGCAHIAAFSNPTQDEQTILENIVYPNSVIHVFRLTEDYIQRQIVVPEE